MGWLAVLVIASFASYPARAWELENGLRSGMTMDEVRRAMPGYELKVLPRDVGAAFKNVYLVENGNVSFSTAFCHDSLVQIRWYIDRDTDYRVEQTAIAAYGQPTVKQEKVPSMDENGKVKTGGGYSDITVRTWMMDSATRETLEIMSESGNPGATAAFSLDSAFPCN
jgi:hypothetical protein